MSRFFGLLVLSCLGLTSLSASTIQYRLDQIGGGYRYTYFLSNFDLLSGQELAIQFDPQLYGQLSNGVAGAGFDLLLFQPNSPPQADGVYSAEATVDHPSLSGTFSVDFTYLGLGTPGSQQFMFFDDNSSVRSLPAGGFTIPVTGTPEPSAILLCTAGMLFLGTARSAKRRIRPSSKPPVTG